jgi:hypothetical protein
LNGVPNFSLASGTSLAAPVVTAVAATYKAHNPTLTNNDLRIMLHDNAADWGVPGIDPSFGVGLVQMKPGVGTVLVTNRSDRKQFQLIEVGTGKTFTTWSSDATYMFNNIPAGDYYLLMASDEDNDGVYGETGEAVGTHVGYMQNAGSVTQPAFGPFAGVYTGTAGWPGTQAEPANDFSTTPSELFVGYYAQATLDSAGDVDWFKLTIENDGVYRIWTEGVNGIDCRPDQGDMDVALELTEPGGTFVASDDNSLNMNCAEIDMFLSAGTYFLQVSPGFLGGNPGEATIVHLDSN